ncbi:unnamed protein product [Pedinophyceae sp. YPF-701]|nr:unnamed protein product [Pedinophyceae sp. YPF-701]
MQSTARFVAAPAARPAVRPRAACVAQASKAAEFRSLSVEAIDEKVDGLKRELFDMRMKQATRQEVKSHEFKLKKKEVARLLTVRREKTLEQGLDRRTANKLEKNALLKEGALVR